MMMKKKKKREKEKKEDSKFRMTNVNYLMVIPPVSFKGFYNDVKDIYLLAIIYS